jgi:subtilisin family serine protease
VAMSKPSSKLSQYVILPARGLKAQGNDQGKRFLESLVGSFGKMATPKLTIGLQPAPKIKVLDSIHEDGAKLVETSVDHLVRLRTAEPGIRIVPVVWYRSAVVRPTLTKKVTLAAGAAVGVQIQVSVVAQDTGQPVRGAEVIAFTDFAQRVGAQATTNAQGRASLALGASSKKVERIFVLPKTGFWPLMKKNVVLNSSTVLRLQSIDFTFDDCVRHFYGSAALNIGAGVKVGVVDSGVDNHQDLAVDGGTNTVTGESPTDFGDNGGEGHGTHVAGIIAARGSAPTGLRGIAPGVTLRSYRVFGRGADSASSFSIAKAIDAAVADGCDLINMSLGGGDEDPLTDDAISGARAAGTVVLAANGNDDRQPVSFPAAFDLCLAVAAMGRKGTFPAGAATVARVAKPFGTDAHDFVASFSNIGEDTDLIGPGVGVVSTVPGGYTVMDGTSMACPAATGALARRLAQNPQILGMSRNQARSNAIIGLFETIVSSLGFGPAFEGRGMIQG